MVLLVFNIEDLLNEIRLRAYALKKSANIRLCSQCRQEYKIPALYVMDSVIRQSRHQVTSEVMFNLFF